MLRGYQVCAGVGDQLVYEPRPLQASAPRWWSGGEQGVGQAKPRGRGRNPGNLSCLARDKGALISRLFPTPRNSVQACRRAGYLLRCCTIAPLEHLEGWLLLADELRICLVPQIGVSSWRSPPCPALSLQPPGGVPPPSACHRLKLVPHWKLLEWPWTEGQERGAAWQGHPQLWGPQTRCGGRSHQSHPPTS